MPMRNGRIRVRFETMFWILFVWIGGLLLLGQIAKCEAENGRTRDKQLEDRRERALKAH